MTIQQYLTWFDEVVAPTEPMFRLIPPEKLDFKPNPSSFTIGQLISHIPLSLSFNTKVINGDPLPLKSLREIFVANRRQAAFTVEQAIECLRAALPSYHQAVERLGDNRFQGEFLDTPQKGRVQYWRICLFVAEHHIHHLMELHLDLKLIGVNVNTRTLYQV